MSLKKELELARELNESLKREIALLEQLARMSRQDPGYAQYPAVISSQPRFDSFRFRGVQQHALARCQQAIGRPCEYPEHKPTTGSPLGGGLASLRFCSKCGHMDESAVQVFTNSGASQ